LLLLLLWGLLHTDLRVLLLLLLVFHGRDVRNSRGATTGIWVR
jgi:hypothetical protein